MQEYTATEPMLLPAEKMTFPFAGAESWGQRVSLSLSQAGAEEDHVPLERHKRTGAPTSVKPLLQL